MNDETVAKLAVKIAELIDAEKQSSDVPSLFASIERLNHRLDKLESAMESKPAAQFTAPFTHPSQDRFAIAEAIVDSLFDHHQNEKACTFEPSKPCDHCSMCSSRGF
jgi:hypothetical protein